MEFLSIYRIQSMLWLNVIKIFKDFSLKSRPWTNCVMEREEGDRKLVQLIYFVPKKLISKFSQYNCCPATICKYFTKYTNKQELKKVFTTIKWILHDIFHNYLFCEYPNSVKIDYGKRLISTNCFFAGNQKFIYTFYTCCLIGFNGNNAWDFDNIHLCALNIQYIFFILDIQ